jgi:glucosamine-6-phosphate deaminase
VRITIHPDKQTLGAAAAAEGVAAMEAAIAARGRAVIVLATGASQFEMLDALVNSPLDFSRVTAFHLDEYVGLDEAHPASFRRYLRERVLERVPALGDLVMIAGDADDLGAEVARLNARLGAETVDLCFAGIGENCHLAFNDPPADFEVEDPYVVVGLDEACRRQQLGEGWFARLEDVPQRAVSASIRQIMRAKKLVLSVPDRRKAEAVRDAVEGRLDPDCPASIIQRHPEVSLHLDTSAACLLSYQSRPGVPT